jgi:hypothetical protein
VRLALGYLLLGTTTVDSSTRCGCLHKEERRTWRLLRCLIFLSVERWISFEGAVAQGRCELAVPVVCGVRREHKKRMTTVCQLRKAFFRTTKNAPTLVSPFSPRSTKGGNSTSSALTLLAPTHPRSFIHTVIAV